MKAATFAGGALAVVLAASACTTFIRTDRRFSPSPRATPPPMFLDRLPTDSYRSVGIIDSNGGFLDRVNAARAKGKALGCDLVLSERVHWIWVNRQRDAEDRVTPRDSGRFICGLYDATGAAEPAGE